MLRKNFPERRKQRRIEAKQRQDGYDKLSYSERLGKPILGNKERNKLERKRLEKIYA